MHGGFHGGGCGGGFHGGGWGHGGHHSCYGPGWGWGWGSPGYGWGSGAVPLAEGLLVGAAAGSYLQTTRNSRDVDAAYQAGLHARDASQSMGSAPSTGSDSDIVTVLVPVGASPGGSLRVRVDTQDYLVQVPPGVLPGSRLQVRIPKMDRSLKLGTVVYPRTSLQTPSQARLIVMKDHKLDQASSPYAEHGILSIAKGEAVELIDGSIQSGLPAPYGDYVMVRTSDGRVGKMSRFCFAEDCDTAPPSSAPPMALHAPAASDP